MPRRESLPDPLTREWVQYQIEREMNVRMMFEGDGNPKAEVERGWIVEGLIRRGHLALLAGKPKEGKTNLVATLAHAVSQGIPFAGMSTEKGPVLYFAAEESAEEWEHAIHPFLPKDQRGFGIAHAANFRIDHQPDLEGLSRCVDRYKAGLIVVDPLLAAIDGGCGTSERARRALTGLKRICMAKGVAAIVVHHARECRGLARRVAENPQLAATASLNIVLNYRPHCGGRLVTLALQGRGPQSNRTIKLVSRGPCSYGRHPLSSPRDGSPDDESVTTGDERGSGGEL